MPPRLSTWGALRGNLQTRLFTTTPAPQAPRNVSPAAALGALGSDMASKNSPRNSPGGAHNNRSSANDVAMRMLKRSERGMEERRASFMEFREQKREEALAQEYLKQMPRNWQSGDVYAPHDLSPSEMNKFKKRLFRPKIDIVDTLNIRPLDMYKNFTLISEFTTSAGQLRSAAHTRLRQVNHRRIAKMVRRAIGMGLHPSTHAHPEYMRSRFFPDERGDRQRR